MPVQVRANDLVEDARVHDHTAHREHCGNERRERSPIRTRDVTIDHKDCRDCIDGRDGAEHDERRTGNTPEPLSICAQRGAEHVPHARAPLHVLGKDRSRRARTRAQPNAIPSTAPDAVGSGRRIMRKALIKPMRPAKSGTSNAT